MSDFFLCWFAGWACVMAGLERSSRIRLWGYIGNFCGLVAGFYLLVAVLA